MGQARIKKLKREAEERARGERGVTPEGWHAFYQKKLTAESKSYLADRLRYRYKPYFDFLKGVVDMTYGPHSGVVVELGVEPGLVTTALNYEHIPVGDGYAGFAAHLFPLATRRGYSAPLFWVDAENEDRSGDFRIPGYQRTIARHLRVRFNGKNTFPIITSFGLLEHFTDEEITSLTSNMREWWQVHYVPLDGHETPSLGDERLLPASHWKDLLSLSYHETFNEGKDLVFCLPPVSALSKREQAWIEEESEGVKNG